MNWYHISILNVIRNENVFFWSMSYLTRAAVIRLNKEQQQPKASCVWLKRTLLLSYFNGEFKWGRFLARICLPVVCLLTLADSSTHQILWAKTSKSSFFFIAHALALTMNLPIHYYYRRKQTALGFVLLQFKMREKPVRHLLSRTIASSHAAKSIKPEMHRRLR